jgi:hypothetical protein
MIRGEAASRRARSHGRGTRVRISARAGWDLGKGQADDRARKRAELLAATERSLSRVEAQVRRKRAGIRTAAEIGVAVGAELDRHKMAKHFTLDIRDGHLSWRKVPRSQIDRCPSGSPDSCMTEHNLICTLLATVESELTDIAANGTAAQHVGKYRRCQYADCGRNEAVLNRCH